MDKSPWIVHHIIRRPCCVMWVSMGMALLLTTIILGLTASGVFPFELDMSPGAFNVKGDPVADRGDAFTATMESTTDVARVTEVNERPIAWHAQEGLYVLFEHRGDGDILQDQNMARIRKFETDIRALPDFEKFCERAPQNITDPPHIDLCLNLFFPSMLVNAPVVEVPALNPGDASMRMTSCCDCDGNNTQGTPGVSAMGLPPCYPPNAYPLCKDENTTVKLYVPTGERSDYVGPEVIAQVRELLACNNDKDGAVAGVVNFFLDDQFEAKGQSVSTRASVALGTVIDCSEWKELKFLSLGDCVAARGRVDKVVINTWILEHFKPLMDSFNEESQVEIAALHAELIQWQILDAIVGSSLVSIGSMIFTTGYMTLHLGSLFLTMLGFFHIVISFPVTWFLYRIVFQMEYMGMLNFIALFVIIGIGADDIFVLSDAWKQSALQPKKVSGTIEARMAWAYRRAAMSMLITSLTDAAAFLANCISAITVIRLFGLFMGLLVMVNFAMVITWFPAVIIAHYKLGLDRGWCPQWRQLMLDTEEIRKLNDAADAEEAAKQVQSAEPLEEAASDEAGDKENKENKEEGKSDTEAEQAKVPEASPGRQVKQARIEHFFEEIYAPRMLVSWVPRLVIMLVALVLVGVLGGLATQLKPSDKDFRAETFPDTTNVMRALTINERFTSGASGTAKIFMVWGLGTDGTKAVDRSNVDRNDPASVGTPNWASDFNPALPANQELFLKACDVFGANRETVGHDTSRPEVHCFMRHFRDWRTIQNMSFPVTEAEFEYSLGVFVSQPDAEACAASPSIECVSYHDSAVKYPSAFRQGIPSNLAWKDSVRWECARGTCAVGGSLTALTLNVNVSMPWDVSAFNARPTFDALEKSAQEVNRQALPSMQGFQVEVNSESSKWMQMRTEETLTSAAFWGCVISVLFAFVILTLATLNWILGALSILAIGAIITSAIGFLVLADWQFGTMEAICVTIVVGFSVDFVVHLAVAYKEASGDRYHRTRQALSELGISVFGAALTTGVSALFMLFAPMLAFVKLGAFITFDIFFSLFIAIGPFAVALATLGPVGDQGSLRPVLCAACCPWKVWERRKQAPVKALEARQEDVELDQPVQDMSTPADTLETEDEHKDALETEPDEKHNTETENNEETEDNKASDKGKQSNEPSAKRDEDVSKKQTPESDKEEGNEQTAKSDNKEVSNESEEEGNEQAAKSDEGEGNAQANDEIIVVSDVHATK